jgi:hypothetical protein
MIQVRSRHFRSHIHASSLRHGNVHIFLCDEVEYFIQSFILAKSSTPSTPPPFPHIIYATKPNQHISPVELSWRSALDFIKFLIVFCISDFTDQNMHHIAQACPVTNPCPLQLGRLSSKITKSSYPPPTTHRSSINSNFEILLLRYYF